MEGATRNHGNPLRDCHAANFATAHIQSHRHLFGSGKRHRTFKRQFAQARCSRKHCAIGHECTQPATFKLGQNLFAFGEHAEMFLQGGLVGLAVIKPCRHQVGQYHRQNFGSDFGLNLAAFAGEPYLQAGTKLTVVNPQGISHQHLGSSRIEYNRGVLIRILFFNQSRKLAVQEIAQRQTTFKRAAPFARIAEHRKIRLDHDPRGRRIRIALHMQEFQRKVTKIPWFVCKRLVETVIFAI